jgi:hypothetical protein
MMVALAALAPSRGPREPMLLSSLAGVSGTNTPALLLFPGATIGNVMLVTRIQFGGATLLGSKAQRKETQPKSRCQCHACGEREDQGKNSSCLHGDHRCSATFRG